eukprot:sb/3465971/
MVVSVEYLLDELFPPAPLTPASNQTWLRNCSDYLHPSDSDDWRCWAIMYARNTCAILSAVGSVIVGFIILINRRYRLTADRMMLYLLLPSLLVSCVTLYNRICYEEMGCKIVGMFMNLGILGQRLTMLCLVINLLVFEKFNKSPRYLELGYISITITTCVALSSFPWVTNSYGPAGVWCWIKGETSADNEMRFGCFYFWMLSAILVEIILFSMLLYRLFKSVPASSQTRENARVRRKYVFPLMKYPLVNFVLAIPVTTNRIQNWLAPDEPIFWLFLLHSMVYPLWGFINAAVYFLTMTAENRKLFLPSRVWESLKECFVDCRSCERDSLVENVDAEPGRIARNERSGMNSESHYDSQTEEMN